MNLLNINCNYYGSHLHEDWAKSLQTYGISTTFFVPVAYTFSETTVKKKVITSKCFNKFDRISFFTKQKKIYRALLQTGQIKKFDFIYGNTLFSDGNIAYMLKKEFNIPYAVAVRNTDINAFLKYKPWLSKQGQKILEESDGIIFISKIYKEIFFDKYIPSAKEKELNKKTYIIPNAIDNFWIENCVSKPHEISKKEKELNLIFVGRIDQNKNIKTIQKAMNILRHQGIYCTLKIIGPISDYGVFKTIVKDSHTIYKEKMPKELLINEYRNSDIYVMPSFTETFGLVYVEAMSQGLPVIYTKQQGFDGFFEEGEVGFSVNSKSSQSVANAILKCLHGYTERSKRCIEKAKLFNWESISKMYYEAFTK